MTCQAAAFDACIVVTPAVVITLLSLMLTLTTRAESTIFIAAAAVHAVVASPMHVLLLTLAAIVLV